MGLLGFMSFFQISLRYVFQVCDAIAMICKQCGARELPIQKRPLQAVPTTMLIPFMLRDFWRPLQEATIWYTRSFPRTVVGAISPQRTLLLWVILANGHQQLPKRPQKSPIKA